MKLALPAPMKGFTPASFAGLFPCATNTLGMVAVAVYLIPLPAMLEHGKGIASGFHFGVCQSVSVMEARTHNAPVRTG